MIGGIITTIAGVVDTVADKVAIDADTKAKLRQETRLALLDHEKDLRAQAAGIVTAEAQSEHKLAAIWRPTLMLVFVGIIANNYIVAPYVALIAGQDVTLPIPADLWALIKIGVGGYIGSRGAEKVAREWKGKGAK